MTTKITSRKNEYDHKVIDCPFCLKLVYLRDSTLVSPDPLRDLKRHITSEAKNEALAVALEPGIETPHLTYYKDHTSETQVIRLKKRGYDKDLELEQ